MWQVSDVINLKIMHKQLVCKHVTCTFVGVTPESAGDLSFTTPSNEKKTTGRSRSMQSMAICYFLAYSLMCIILYKMQSLKMLVSPAQHFYHDYLLTYSLQIKSTRSRPIPMPEMWNVLFQTRISNRTYGAHSSGKIWKILRPALPVQPKSKLLTHACHFNNLDAFILMDHSPTDVI
ncbi:hypothetical protein EGR_05377 [Echinococcus granulosus]|uniref:Uncharacterized protein n=1 Tax=Echinococcus granulosus TaxID=6210 RepID=W6UND9_ECHGR|nr:hypothetical protein EGR_05377 [Echinococcus granulosus]EUB59757.1 hypothetical protein EGR_05377 [Echinococcus granulosus]